MNSDWSYGYARRSAIDKRETLAVQAVGGIAAWLIRRLPQGIGQQTSKYSLKSLRDNRILDRGAISSL